MFLDRFLEQIRNAETRYSEHHAQREQRKTEIEHIDEGRLDEVDFSVLDEGSRISNRMALYAESAESLVRGAVLPRVSPQEVILERIIKTNELMSSAFLIEGARVCRSVGRVVIRGTTGTVLGYGTGSLVSPRLIMTNNHVLEDRESARNSTIQFDFLELLDGTQTNLVEYSLAPDEFFMTDSALDFTLVAVDKIAIHGESLELRGWSPLLEESGKVVVGERVNIIQHPGGQRQQLALRQNRIVDVVGDFLHYEADTQQGSSGSPVANDAWQLAALHHAGVPNRDEQGRILLLSGVPWDRSRDTIGQIAWKANEGARISKIIEHVRSRETELSEIQQSMFADAFTSPPPFPDLEERKHSEPAPALPTQKLRIDEAGRLVYTIPVEVAVGIPDAGRLLAPPQPKAPVKPTIAPSLDSRSSTGINEEDLQNAQAAYRAHETDLYYDEAADLGDIEDYYAGIAEDEFLVGQPLFDALHSLLKETHVTVLSYKQARLEHLYPWVDLRPDRKLNSIYSGEGFDVTEVIRRDLEIEALHEAMLARFIRSESGRRPEMLEAFLESLEASSPFNCEHVVPQSWFAKKQPMKADLHHLFTCESDCNSFRGNIPYFQFPPVVEAVRPKCGRRETSDRKFEPTAGKGPVARATLYFLIRYSGLIGDEARELQSERLPILLQWHADEPVTVYEQHRNAAIRASQGNRNPLIDFPEWAEHIDFTAGFGG